MTEWHLTLLKQLASRLFSVRCSYHILDNSTENIQGILLPIEDLYQLGIDLVSMAGLQCDAETVISF